MHGRVERVVSLHRGEGGALRVDQRLHRLIAEQVAIEALAHVCDSLAREHLRNPQVLTCNVVDERADIPLDTRSSGVPLLRAYLLSTFDEAIACPPERSRFIHGQHDSEASPRCLPAPAWRRSPPAPPAHGCDSPGRRGWCAPPCRPWPRSG